MSLIELKSDLGKFRKEIISSINHEVKSLNLPKKSTSKNVLQIPYTNLPKLSKVDYTLNFQPKTFTYKKYKVGGNLIKKLPKTDKILSFINQQSFNTLLLPKIITTTLPTDILRTKSLFKLKLPSTIQYISNFVKITPTAIKFISLYTEQLPNLIQHISNFKKSLPKQLAKISLYKDQIPKVILHLSLYKDHEVDYFNNLTSGAVGFTAKMTTTKFLGINNGRFTFPLTVPGSSRYAILPIILDLTSRYDSNEKVKRQIKNNLPLLKFYTLPIGATVVDNFKNETSGAVGFTPFMKLTQFLGYDFTTNSRYTYPSLVPGSSRYKSYPNLVDNTSNYDFLNKIKNRLQPYSFVFGLYNSPIGSIVTDYFNNNNSGANGFTSFMDTTQYIGFNGNKYNYPITVKNGRLVNLNSYILFYQKDSLITFINNLVSAKLKRTYYTSDTPYTVNNDKLANESRGLYTWSQTRQSPSPLELIYSSYDLRTSSYNRFLNIFDQPFIIRGIQREGITNKRNQRWGLVSIDDGLIRGGILTSTERALVDVVRIGKFLTSPKGLLFILKQIGLQRSNPNSQTFISTQKFDPISLVSNIATQHLGIRIRRDGIPLVPALKYESVASIDTTNRLKLLYNELLTTPLIRKGFEINTLSKNGGPNSLYGVGRTSIRRYIISNNILYNELPITNRFSDLITYINTYRSVLSTGIYNEVNFKYTPTEFISNRNYETILNSRYNQYNRLSFLQLRRISKERSNITTQIINFLQRYDSDVNISWRLSEPVNYSLVNMHRIYGIPDYITNRDLRDLKKSPEISIDKINSSRVLKNIPADLKDFIKFSFNNFWKPEHLMFRAYLMSYGESYTPEFKHIHIIGRADSAYLYSSYERTINIVFKVHASSRVELKPIWEKLNKLANFTMPEYNVSLDYRMKSPLMEVTIGDLFEKTPCLLSALSYDLDEDSLWEININNESDIAQLPVTITVQMNLIILNRRRPTNNSWNYSDKAKI